MGRRMNDGWMGGFGGSRWVPGGYGDPSVALSHYNRSGTERGEPQGLGLGLARGRPPVGSWSLGHGFLFCFLF